MRRDGSGSDAEHLVIECKAKLLRGVYILSDFLGGRYLKRRQVYSKSTFHLISQGVDISGDEKLSNSQGVVNSEKDKFTGG